MTVDPWAIGTPVTVDHPLHATIAAWESVEATLAEWNIPDAEPRAKAIMARLECADVTDDVSAEEFEAREALRSAVRLGQVVEVAAAVLAIPRGSVVVLSGPIDPAMVAEWLPALRHAAGHDEFTVVEAEPGETLDVLDEDDMRVQGWRRC